LVVSPFLYAHHKIGYDIFQPSSTGYFRHYAFLSTSCLPCFVSVLFVYCYHI